jgi:PTS system nitrogen regulatory IIA component
VRNPPQILETLAGTGAVYHLDTHHVLERILEREALGTGFGRGVAIPHARIEG